MSSALARAAARAVIGFTLGAFTGAEPAFAQPSTPTLSGPVIDEAGMLDAGEENRLTQRMSEMFQTGGPQMQVWTFPSLEGDDIAPVGIRAADAWKIGRAGKDDGVILLIAARERRTRLEVGRGLEGAIPDVIAGRILRDVLRPALRAGQTYDGILGVIAIVEKAARGELPAGVAGPADGRDARDEGFNPFKLFFGVVFFFLVFILGPLGSLLGGRRRGGRSGGIFFPGFGGGGGWGGGGGGGGGWSGGGGSFGGGGGGGDW